MKDEKKFWGKSTKKVLRDIIYIPLDFQQKSEHIRIIIDGNLLFRSFNLVFVLLHILLEKLVLTELFLLDLTLKTWFATWFVMDSWNERDFPKGHIYIAASSFTTNINFMMKMKSGIAAFGEIFEYFRSSIFLEHFSKKPTRISAREKRVLIKISQVCH